MASSTQSPNAQLEQEKLQLSQLDGMMLTGFKAQGAPATVRDAWDNFISKFKEWKGIE
jgi:hypothetical protein